MTQTTTQANAPVNTAPLYSLMVSSINAISAQLGYQSINVIAPRTYLVNRPAVLLVRSASTINKDNKDKGSLDGEVIFATDYFFLSTVQESGSERIAPLFSLGGGRVDLGGPEPKQYAYSGKLIDTYSRYVDGGTGVLKHFYGCAELYDAYQNFFRGKVCAEKQYVVELRYRDQWRRGYLSNITMDYDAANVAQAGLMMTMYIVEEGSF